MYIFSPRENSKKLLRNTAKIPLNVLKYYTQKYACNTNTAVKEG